MRNLRTVFIEAIVLAMIGIGFGLAANALSPRGLSLSRDYFQRAASTPAPNFSTNATPASPDEELRSRLAQKGLSLVDGAKAEQLFRDPQYEQELIIFIDARDDRHYEEGHIPGAYQFDRYYPEKYLPIVLPACLTAAKIVVYCTGGKCEDSEFAAITLAEAGVPAGNILVYGGGITDWMERRLPVETGVRKSGSLKP